MEPVVEQSAQPGTKRSFKDKLRDHHIRRPVLMVFIVSILLVLVTVGSVAAFIALTTDRAVFKSRLTVDNPVRQHLLRIEGDGEVVATLRDTTSNDSDKVRYNLSLLSPEGELVQRKIASSAGKTVKMKENVVAGDYTFVVQSEDPLSIDGASYTLRIDYPNDVAAFEDQIAPTVEIVSPELGSDVQGVFTVSGTANDETELAEVSVRVGEDSSWVVAEGTTDWSVQIDSNKFNSEQYIIEVQAIDASGNTVSERTLVNFTNPSPDPEPDPDPNPTPDPDPSPDPSPDPGDGSGDDGNSGGSTPTSFFDDFSQPGWKERYDFDIYHRDDFVQSFSSWLGDHQPVAGGSDPDNCTPPEQQRTIQRGSRPEFNDEWIYRCAPNDNPAAAHLMTSIGDTAGYSIGMFTPKQVFNGISEVSWEQNITDLGDRQWTEIAVLPADKLEDDNYPCISWYPCNSATYANTNAVGVRYTGEEGGTLAYMTPDEPGSDKFYAYADGNPPCSEYKPDFCFGWSFGEDDPAYSSIRTRRTFIMRDEGNGRISLSVEKADGTFQDFDFAGSFPSGDVRVMFKDHNYTPTKSNPGVTFTWHWDNISIN